MRIDEKAPIFSLQNQDGDIVEMRYNGEAENDMIWEPLRIRRDKILLGKDF